MNSTVRFDSNYIGSILGDVSDTANGVISDALDKVAIIMSNSEVNRFLDKLSDQWNNGEKLTNPLITFTRELKSGLYDDLPDDGIDLIHQAAVDLSDFWRSEAEVSVEQFKSNLGYLLVLETIIRIKKKQGDREL